MQQLTAKISSSTEALGRLIGAHSALTGELSAQLVEQHGLSLSECEVLLLLSRAPERAMRRIDLAREVRLSPSGVTRMLDRLEATGLVEKGSCSDDARVTYAVLTPAGAAKLQEAWSDHVAATERLLGERFDEEELAALTELLSRVADPLECEPGPSQA
jgi:DNA-binding MarR family transcriptional regulator